MAGKAEVKAGAAVHAAMRSMLLALVRPHLPQMGLALVLTDQTSDKGRWKMWRLLCASG